jgi:hypothetical protein
LQTRALTKTESFRLRQKLLKLMFFMSAVACTSDILGYPIGRRPSGECQPLSVQTTLCILQKRLPLRWLHVFEASSKQIATVSGLTPHPPCHLHRNHLFLTRVFEAKANECIVCQDTRSPACHALCVRICARPFFNVYLDIREKMVTYICIRRAHDMQVSAYLGKQCTRLLWPQRLLDKNRWFL